MRIRASLCSVTLIAFGANVGVRLVQGQTVSFFRQIVTPGMEMSAAVAADASGVYVFGSGSRTAEAGLSKYDSRGNELWTRAFRTPGWGLVSFLKAAASTTGVYVVGINLAWTGLRKYGTNGDELWNRQLEFSPADVAADSSGVYVAGISLPISGISDQTSYLRKYSLDGSELWTRRVSGTPNSLDGFVGVAVDGTGVYVLGAVFPGPRVFFVRKYDSDGKALWDRQLNTQSWRSTLAAAHPAGFYVADLDQSRDAFVREESGFLRKYDADGNELWARHLATSGFRVTGIAGDATGIRVAGHAFFPYADWQRRGAPALPGQCRSGAGGDSFVRKYSPEGTELWTRQFGTSHVTRSLGLAAYSNSSYVVGVEGPAIFWDDWGLRHAFPEANRDGFLAKLEDSAADGTGSGPRIFPGCVVNAASYIGGGVAPGEIVTIFGSAIGPAEPVRFQVTDGRVANMLAETRILFNGEPSPLLYVSERQSSAIVPYAISGRDRVEVHVEHKGVRSDAVTVPVLTSRPGIFTMDGSGQGQSSILNEDGSINSPSNPARRGTIITIFATGGGETAPGVVDGQIVGNVLPKTTSPLSVFFDLDSWALGSPTLEGEVLYAGSSPGSVAGLLQVNVRVPLIAQETGDAVPFALLIGSQWTAYQATVSLR